MEYYLQLLTAQQGLQAFLIILLQILILTPKEQYIDSELFHKIVINFKDDHQLYQYQHQENSGYVNMVNYQQIIKMSDISIRN